MCKTYDQPNSAPLGALDEATTAPSDASWEPESIQAEDFHQKDTWSNINRAPYDQISGVIYKRAANIQRVLYRPLDKAPDRPSAWQGQGKAVVRWLFSERAGTEEHHLDNATFAFWHDICLSPGASTGQCSHPGEVHVLYVIAGNGILYHRPTDGSPVIARPLRPGDAALIRDTEYYSIANEAQHGLRLMVLGLTT